MSDLVFWGESPIRLDKYLSKELPFSRSKIERAIKDGDIRVNGKKAKASFILKEGDEINLTSFDPNLKKIEAEDIDLDIIYEDEDILIINKPAGMIVHPTETIRSGSLVNALLNYTDQLSKLSGEERPGIVHRLDMDTSGLILVCKNDPTYLYFKDNFKERRVKKKYLALINGIMDPREGDIRENIKRDSVRRKRMKVDPSGRPAWTHYETLETYKGASEVEIDLHTGRTHQIRVHFHYMGHPLLGDKLYKGPKFPVKVKRQMLHSQGLSFVHPRTGKEMEFHLDPPDDYMEVKDKLKRL